MRERGVPVGAAARIVVVCALFAADIALVAFVVRHDDQIDHHHSAITRASGALAGTAARPSNPEAVAATSQAVEALIDSGAQPDATALAEDYEAWLADPSSERALAALRDRVAAEGEANLTGRAQVHQVAAALYLVQLLLLAVGLAYWYRRWARSPRPPDQAWGERLDGLVEITSLPQRDELLARRSMRGELRLAINADQLVLHYQPTIDLSDDSVCGFEALVRWQHPSDGLLLPESFIAFAEQSGLIVDLGSWVLREACQAAMRLRTVRHQPTMSVNVAAQQIARPDFLDIVDRALEESGLPAADLVLEVTESVQLVDLDAAVTVLASLRARGVRIAVDDFGSGYSCLAYLSRLPVDILKIDKALVDELNGTGRGPSLTAYAVALGRQLELTTVAEGVELPEQAEWLRRSSCTMAQGFLWSRPVGLAAAHRLVDARGCRGPAQPPRRSASRRSSSTLGSSMVDGTAGSEPSAI